MRERIEINKETLDRFRQLVSDIPIPSHEIDEAIFLVGRIVQSTIDRACGTDSVQIAQRFSEENHSISDSVDASFVSAERARLSASKPGLEP